MEFDAVVFEGRQLGYIPYVRPSEMLRLLRPGHPRLPYGVAEELRTAMGRCGAGNVAELDRRLIRRR
jgi:hypothetical protein